MGVYIVNVTETVTFLRAAETLVSGPHFDSWGGTYYVVRESDGTEQVREWTAGQSLHVVKAFATVSAAEFAVAA